MSFWESGVADADMNTSGWDSKNDQSWDQGKSQAEPPFDNNFDEGGGDGFAAGDSEEKCRNCDTPGHFARDCPEPRKDITCFNCGGPHMKKDCDQPMVSNRVLCKLCKTEGDHDTAQCNAKYPLDLNDVPDLTEAECWKLVQEVDDTFDLKEALKALQKASPGLTYPAIENQLRKMGHKYFLVALKKDTGGGLTNVDFQGNKDKTYALSIQKSPHCPRAAMLDSWPESSEDNMNRLADAGTPLSSGLIFCRNCEKYGSHIAKNCSDEKSEVERVKIICALCGEEGHRVRDCTQERHKPREPRTCKICGSEDHIAKECDQKPAMVCRNCEQEGHRAADCTEPRKIVCNNCDVEGHISKDCNLPRDWSRVTCRHCGEVGHAAATRCKPGAAKLESEADENAAPDTENTAAGAADDWNNNNVTTKTADNEHKASGVTTANGTASWGNANTGSAAAGTWEATTAQPGNTFAW